MAGVREVSRVKIGEIHEYGYGDGKRILNAEYLLKDKVLRVRIEGTSPWSDYLGFPRMQPWPNSPIKLHGEWHHMARVFALHLRDEIAGHKVNEIRLMGRGIGGAVAAIMPIYLPFIGIQRQVILINSPKIGNSAASRWIWDDVMLENSTVMAVYGEGDIVRLLPLFYCRYPWNRPFEKTRPFWKAQQNLPEEWGEFFK
jgi:hypothetical protein